MRRILLFLSLVLGASLAIQPVIHAHVLIKDQTGQAGAVLHVTPDDDPIAGQKSELYYSTQGIDGAKRASLTVVAQDGSRESVQAQVTGQGVSTEYTFPARGVYELRLRVDTVSGERMLNYTQRVERGGTDGADLLSAMSAGMQHRAWAEPLLAVVIIAVFVLLILLFNRRVSVARHVARAHKKKK